MSSTKNPHILVVHTDQQRYDTLGINGNRLIRTPNLDALGRAGVTLHGAHAACPICVPSRVSFFTGRHAHATKSYHNVIGLQPGERDFVSLLREHGYTTALIGKDHCFGRGRDRQVFDSLSRASHTCFLPPRNRHEREINEFHGGNWEKPYCRHDIPPDEDVSGRLCLEACEYIRTKHDREFGQPFFLWLSIPEPHEPYDAPRPFADMYDDVDIPGPFRREGEMDDKPARQRLAAQVRARQPLIEETVCKDRIRTYWGSVSYIDAYVGRVLETIEECGIADETIVVFTSDHGDYMGDHGLINKFLGLYDCLTHVPLIIRCPGIVPRQSRALVQNLDIMPTVLDLAGITPDHPHHGRSFRPVLDGGPDVHRDALLLEHGCPGEPLHESRLDDAERAALLDGPPASPNQDVFNTGRSTGIRTDRWKLVILPGDVDELYDLENDPHELHNRSDDPHLAPVKADLTRRLLEEMIRTQDEALPAQWDELARSRWWD